MQVKAGQSQAANTYWAPAVAQHWSGHIRVLSGVYLSGRTEVVCIFMPFLEPKELPCAIDFMPIL